METTTEVRDLIHEIAIEGVRKKDVYSFEEHPILKKLRSLGSQLWMDTGDREAALTLWKKELSALTTNNTLANQVVQTGTMDKDIQYTISRIREKGIEINEDNLIIEIGFVINCKIALRLVEAFDTRVSVELHPVMSCNIEKSLTYARRYYQVNPERFIVKVPLTPEGYLIARKLATEEIPVNFTLGFSARQNYLAARLSNPAYVNVFLGRLNAVVSDNSIGTGKYVGEKVTLAAQKALDRVKQDHPDIKTSLIGASVRNAEQVINLAGMDLLTIPPKAIQELYESGISPEDISNKKDTDYETGLENQGRFQELWEVNDDFKALTDDLLRMDLDNMDGNDLVRACSRRGINLFYPFNSKELKQIKKQGKIPKLDNWDIRIGIDDLMTQSALQSFTKDQEELDNRIKGFL